MAYVLNIEVVVISLESVQDFKFHVQIDINSTLCYL